MIKNKVIRILVIVSPLLLLLLIFPTTTQAFFLPLKTQLYNHHQHHHHQHQHHQPHHSYSPSVSSTKRHSSSSSTNTNTNTNNLPPFPTIRIPPYPQLPTTRTNAETSPTAEADLAFRRAISLETTGQARSAHAHFHEAATLYQCLLEEIDLTTTTTSSSSSVVSSASSVAPAFAHVTDFDPSNPGLLKSVLAYACARLAYLSVDALGDPHAAARLYLDAIRIDIDGFDGGGEGGGGVSEEVHAAYYDGMGTAIEAACGTTQQAVEAYRKGLVLLKLLHGVEYDAAEEEDEDGGGSSRIEDRSTESSKSLEKVLSFHLAVALERLGGEANLEESTAIVASLRRPATPIPTKNDTTNHSNNNNNNNNNHPTSSSSNHHHHFSHLVDSWGYVRWHTRHIPNPSLNLYLGTRSLLQIGVEAALPLLEQDGGFVCEFGVATGRSLRMLQEILPLNTALHGFDTFGVGSTTSTSGDGGGLGAVPTMSGEVTFHDGLFVDTIPEFLGEYTEGYRPLAFANIDCDFYGSTLSILEQMHSRVVPGTVFCFDEYLCHPTWRQDEFRAWRECCKRFGWQYEYLGFSLWTKQAVVRVTSA